MNLDIQLGVDSFTNWGSWNVNFHRNTYKNTELGHGYINSEFARMIAAEEYYEPGSTEPLTLDDERAIALMAHTTVTDLKSSYWNLSAGVGIDSLFELTGGAASAYFHGEYQETTYMSIPDSLSDAGVVIGGAGGGVGDREVWSLAAEIRLPVLDNVEVNIAGRYDDYSDFGDNFSPQISAKWDFYDGWAVRASWGEGFRAPSFGNLFNSSYGFPWVSVDGAPTVQIETLTAGSPELQAEKSETFNIGLIGQINDNWNFTVDYYNIEIDDVISSVGAQTLQNMYEDGRELPAGLGIEFNAAGFPVSYRAGMTNSGELTMSGIDFTLNSRYDTAFGIFSGTFQANHVLERESTYGFEGPMVDYIGIDGYPEWRLNGRLGWSYGSHAVNFTIQYIDSQLADYRYDAGSTSFVPVDNPGSGYYKHHTPSYTELGVNYAYQFTDNLRLAAGVTNLTDAEPAFYNNADTDYDFYLYSPRGRTYFANVTLRF